MKLKANAKINFSLSVCGKREDGYHLIDTVMHSVSLYDTVWIEKTDEINVLCGDMPQEENIAYKAAKLFFEVVGISGGCKIKIEKHIPMCAGLGGGSTDAAAVLLGLDRLYETKLSFQALCDMALQLGADVPFFIKGGCMRSEGIGEILTPAIPLKKGYILLAKADEKPSTGEMYRRLDAQNTVLADTKAVLSAIEKNDLNNLSRYFYNAFETVWPKSAVKAELLKSNAECVGLTGSGPTWFAVYADKQKALNAHNALKSKKIPVWLCCPCDCAIEFE